MKPCRLVLTAFGSFAEKTVIDFNKSTENIFLITGDTGSGKTTIFDGIVFAMYGETSAMQYGKKPAMLQSQFASYDVTPTVEFTFALSSAPGAETYKITRSPRCMKYSKNKGNKNILVEKVGSTLLETPNGIYKGKEAQNKILELVGMDKSQFTQVAMIAQGDFMKLLLTTSAEKTVIFRKLFHTEIFERITDELKKRKKEAEQKINELKVTCRTQADGIAINEQYEYAAKVREYIAEFDESLARLDEFLPLLKKMCEDDEMAYNNAVQAWEKQNQKKETLLQQQAAAKSIEDAFENRRKSQQLLQEYNEQKEAMTELAQWVENTRKIGVVKPYYENMQKDQKSYLESSNKLKELQAQKPVVNQQYLDSKKQFESKSQEHDVAKEKRDVNSQQLNEELGRITERAQLLKAQSEEEKKIKNQETTLLQMKEQHQKQEERYKQIEQVLENGQEYRVRNEKIIQQQQKLQQFSKQLDEIQGDYEKMNSYHDTALHRISDYIKVYKELEQKNEAYNQLNTIFINEQAGILAQSLKANMPCPVCGSLEHPAPAKISADQNVTKESVEQAKIALDQANVEEQKEREKCIEIKKAIFDLDSHLAQKLEVRCQELLLKEHNSEYKVAISQDTMELLKAAQDEHLSYKLETYLKDTVSQNVQSERGYNNHREVYLIVYQQLREWYKVNWNDSMQQKNECEKQIALLEKTKQEKETLQKELTAYQKNQELAEQKRNELNQAYRQIEGQIGMLNKQIKHTSKEEITQLVNEINTEYDKIKQEYLKVKNAYEQMQNSWQQLTTQITEKEQLVEQQKQACLLSQKQLQSLLKKSEMSENEFTQKLQEYDEVAYEQSRMKVVEYQQAYKTAEATLEAANQLIKGVAKPDVEKINEELSTCTQLVSELDQQKQILASPCKTNQAIYNKLLLDWNKVEEYYPIYQHISNLYAVAAGQAGNKNNSRLNLETYVQRYYLQRILHWANEQFSCMTAGQFELQLKKIEETQNGGNEGLDFMIYSTVTDTTRDVRTLSGGESFMAALSLALGVAEEIQRTDGAIHMDMMFIDEGFGSLDDFSRNCAVDLLKRMANNNRMIGIISHVTELKSAIDNQLIVKKDKMGSHCKWQV